MKPALRQGRTRGARKTGGSETRPYEGFGWGRGVVRGGSSNRLTTNGMGEVRSRWCGWVPGVASVRSDGWVLLGPGRGRRDVGGECRGDVGAGKQNTSGSRDPSADLAMTGEGAWWRVPGCAQPGPHVRERGEARLAGARTTGGVEAMARQAMGMVDRWA